MLIRDANVFLWGAKQTKDANIFVCHAGDSAAGDLTAGGSAAGGSAAASDASGDSSTSSASSDQAASPAPANEAAAEVDSVKGRAGGVFKPNCDLPFCY